MFLFNPVLNQHRVSLNSFAFFSCSQWYTERNWLDSSIVIYFTVSTKLNVIAYLSAGSQKIVLKPSWNFLAAKMLENYFSCMYPFLSPTRKQRKYNVLNWLFQSRGNETRVDRFLNSHPFASKTLNLEPIGRPRHELGKSNGSLDETLSHITS